MRGLNQHSVAGRAGLKGVHKWRRLGTLSLVVVAACLVTACGGRQAGPYEPGSKTVRDREGSNEAYQASREHRQEDPAEAEALLRQALNLDLYNGPAHNDLGVLLLSQGRLYEAANEFEWARKLMPGHPDPRVNLAIVLDRGGKAPESIDAAQAALDVRPGYLPAIQAIALVQLRSGLVDAKILDRLSDIIMRSNDPQWVEWAKMQKFKLAMR